MHLVKIYFDSGVNISWVISPVICDGFLTCVDRFFSRKRFEAIIHRALMRVHAWIFLDLGGGNWKSVIIF